LYIRPLFGDAISGPSMYAHSGSSKGQWNGETVISVNVRLKSQPKVVARTQNLKVRLR
jgi:hypothetical protein